MSATIHNDTRYAYTLDAVLDRITGERALMPDAETARLAAAQLNAGTDRDGWIWS